MKPYEAYKHAKQHGPSDETRAATCEDPEYAYVYAMNVDKAPRDDTRAAACKRPEYACWYARDVDKAPRDDTRAAACDAAPSAYWYARYVDKRPRDDTWEASGMHQTHYLRVVPGAMKPYFKDWLIENRNSYEVMKDFYDWKGSFKKHYEKIRELDIDAAVVYTLSIRKIVV